MPPINGQIAAVSDSWKSINLVTGGSSGSGLSVPSAGDPATWEQLQECTVQSTEYKYRSRDRQDLSTIDVSGSWLTAATLCSFFCFSVLPFVLLLLFTGLRAMLPTRQMKICAWKEGKRSGREGGRVTRISLTHSPVPGSRIVHRKGGPGRIRTVQILYWIQDGY